VQDETCVLMVERHQNKSEAAAGLPVMSHAR
jgi:hypothetical protein